MNRPLWIYLPVLLAGLAVATSPAAAAVTLTVTPIGAEKDLTVNFGTARSLGPHGEPESDTVVRQVKLTIASTSSKSYAVYQRISGPWLNSSGKELPIESVRFSVSSSGSSGTVYFPNLSPLSLGEQRVFLSDGSGTNQELTLIYNLSIPLGQQAGDYQTNVTYRVESL